MSIARPHSIRPALLAPLFLLLTIIPTRAQGFDIGGILGGAARSALQNGLPGPPVEFDRRPRYRTAPLPMPAPAPQPQSLGGAQHGGAAYVSDGVTLAGSLDQMPVSSTLKCSGSQRRPGMRLCASQSGQSVLSVIVNDAGRVAYFSRFLGNVHLNMSGVQSNISHLTGLYGAPHVVNETRMNSGSYAILVSWGSIAFTQTMSRTGDENDRSLYVQYQRTSITSSDDVALYRIDGGTGFYYVASFDSSGTGTVRYGAYNDGVFDDSTANHKLNPGKSKILANVTAPNSAERVSDGPMDLLMGEWIGEATCDGNHRDISLNVNSAPSPNYGAIIAFFNDNALANIVPHFDMLARQEGPAGMYHFVPSHPYDKLAFTAVLVKEKAILDITSNTCGAFTLARPIMRPVSVLVTNTAPRKQYDSSDRTPDRCSTLNSWASRMTREYPGIDLHNTNMEKLFPKAVLLFSDYDFLPYFGFQYDPFHEPSGVLLAPIGRDLMRSCGDDPFIRQEGADFWGSSLFQLAFSDEVKPFTTYDGGSFSISAIRHFVQKARVVQTVIAKSLAGSHEDPISRISILSDLKMYVDNHKLYLWPSDLLALDDRITSSIQKIALEQKTSEMNQIRAQKDPNKALAMVKVFVSGGLSSINDNLKITDRQKMLSEVDEMTHGYVVTLFAPFQLEMDKVSDDLSGVRELSEIASRAKNTLDQFPDKERAALMADIKARSIHIIIPIISADTKEMLSYSPTKEGLRAQCDWIIKYNMKYREFESYVAVKNGEKEFEKAREDALIGAAPQATADMLKAKEDKSVRVEALRGYLCWSGDRTLPGSLEYDVLATESGLGSLWQ